MLKLSALCQGRQRRWTLFAALGCALLSAGCGTVPQPAPIFIPTTLRQPCSRAQVGALTTQGDADALLVRQEAAVAGCDMARGAVVEIVDHFNDAHAPVRPWWKLWGR